MHGNKKQRTLKTAVPSIPYLFKLFALFASLVSYCAGCLTCWLAWCLAFAASAFFQIAVHRFIQWFYMFHVHVPPYYCLTYIIITFQHRFRNPFLRISFRRPCRLPHTTQMSPISLYCFHEMCGRFRLWQAKVTQNTIFPEQFPTGTAWLLQVFPPQVRR